MDKNCISLANVVEEMKDLDERLRTLEEGRPANQTTEEQARPEIQARVFSTSILLKIECEKRKGVLVSFFRELDKFDLDVSSASVVQFGISVLDVTITVEMGNEFNVPVKDVVTALRSCVQPAASCP